MITCPNCNHQNPEGALQCEACYTPLPEMVACPSCHTPIQADASFCGQCGYDLRVEAKGAQAEGVQAEGVQAEGSAMAKPSKGITQPEQAIASSSSIGSTEVSAIPDSSIPTKNFFVEPDEPQPVQPAVSAGDLYSSPDSNPASAPDIELPELVTPDPLVASEAMPFTPPTPPAPPAPPTPPMTPSTPTPPLVTQLQTLSARLRQVQTGTLIEIPRQLSIVRIGKPNDQTPPDVDVSGFPDSEVVSRVHANLRVEGDVYYIEDVGSSNGTYINGLPLAAGNRHRLRPGDRIALGKGDKVSFLFETA